MSIFTQNHFLNDTQSTSVIGKMSVFKNFNCDIITFQMNALNY